MHIFPNEQTRNRFFIVYVAIICISCAGYFVSITHYRFYRDMNLPLVGRIYQSYSNAVVYKGHVKKLQLMQDLRKPGLRFNILIKPQPHSELITTMRNYPLNDFIKKHHDSFKLAVLLPNQKWLQVTWRKPIHSFWSGIGYIIVILVLLFSFIVFFFSYVNSFTGVVNSESIPI